MILDELRPWVESSLAAWREKNGLETLPHYTLEEPPAGIDADVACNLAMLLSKALRKNPRAIAEEMKAILSERTGPLVESISIAGAGFLNFKLTLSHLQKSVHKLIQEGDRYGRLSPEPKEKVLIEFVSANPTGPLHVGHGRGAALGDSLALILAHLGYPVQREYYINDAGNQVQMLGESLLARRRELEGKPANMPEEGYHGDYMKPLAEAYQKAAPEGGDDVAKATRFALDALQKNIERDLAAFGIRFDSWFSEASLLQKGLVEKHIEQLRKKGFVQEYDGAIWFVAPEEKEKAADPEGERKDKDRVLKRRDGRWTYFATDIAYHADKYERGFKKLIDVWGADHHGYVPRVKGSMQALGFEPDQLHVLLYQLVSLTRSGVPVSMSKRSGDFVTLVDVLQEVGKDACRLFFALRGPNTALDFDLELAKKHTADNPVYYLQYAHARICSIFRQAAEKGVLASPANLSQLAEKEERDLIRRLLLFPHALRVCAQEDSPHPLANYLLSLCRQFHHFYDHHRVLGDNAALSQGRLALLQAVRQVLRLGLSLLGVSAPESM